MRSMSRPGGAWCVRTLMVVGVLWGVVAMHGLTADHSAMQMSVPGATAVAPAVVSEGEAGHGGGSHSAVAICFAIVTAAAAAGLLLLGSRAGRSLLTRFAPRQVYVTFTPRRPRQWALTLAQLSILRT